MNTHTQFLRFAFVGLCTNAFLFLGYLALTKVGIEHKKAMSILYVVGVLSSFLFNQRWSFQHHGKFSPALFRYLTAYLIGYLVNLMVLILFVDLLGFPHEWVQGIMIFVLALAMFLAQKLWVFNSRPLL